MFYNHIGKAVNTLIFFEFVYNHMSYQVLKYASPLDEIFLKCIFYILFVLLVPFKMNSDKILKYSSSVGTIWWHICALCRHRTETGLVSLKITRI